jgi:hypothetical protein
MWELLPALRKALFVSSIKRVELKLGPMEQDAYPNACKFQLLVSNASLLNIKEVVLDFTYFYFRIPHTHPLQWQRRPVDTLDNRPPDWMKVFRGITKAISQRSCESLTIKGGDIASSITECPSPRSDGDIIKRLNSLWCKNYRSNIPLSMARRQQLFRSLIKTFHLPGARLNSMPFDLWPLTTLKTLHIRSSPLIISHPFICWIISSINLSPITVLSFSELGISTLAWSKLLRCLSVPTLSSFSIASSDVQITDIISFLARHPGVTDLNLCPGQLCVKESRNLRYFPFLSRRNSLCRIPSHLLAILPVRNYRALPHIVMLSATPNHVTYLLSTRSRAGSHILPNLSSITIESFHDMRFDPIDCALNAISHSELKDITLMLRIHMVGLSFTDWLKDIAEPVENDPLTHSYWESLHCVKSLHIHAVHDVVPRAVQLIPSWIAKFPAVQEVLLRAPYFEWMGDSQRNVFRAEIMARCPYVQEIHLPRPVGVSDLMKCLPCGLTCITSGVMIGLEFSSRSDPLHPLTLTCIAWFLGCLYMAF